MAIKLSPLAEKQLNDIMYALGCTKSEAICHALESQEAFENITEDQIFNWLDTNYKEQLIKWELSMVGKRAIIDNN